MYDSAIEVLKIIEENGFKAYIVGGYVRDLYIGRKSKDIDIATNAKPMELNEIFGNLTILEDYGAVKLSYKGYIYDITTFRKDIAYDPTNRKIVKIEYTDDINEDILRRDFNINTLYMDSNGNIIDKFNGRKYIDEKLIKTNEDPNIKLKEDPLRILRAIRYATILDFKLDSELEEAIRNNANLLLDLSFYRRKDELNYIFMDSNCNYGLKLISDLNLDKYLEISNLNNVIWCSDILGIWAQLEYSDEYHFSNLENDTILKIREIIDSKIIDIFTVYKYGNYISGVAAEILGIDKKDINDMYNNLTIYDKKDIDIDINDLCKLLSIEPSSIIKDIIMDLEKEIVYNRLSNEKQYIEKYILDKYRKE